MNSATLRNVTPTPELMAKIKRVRVAIAEQQPREIRCPHCKRKIGVAFEDTRGHFETKCEKCGKSCYWTSSTPARPAGSSELNILTFIVMVEIPTSLSEMVTGT